MLVEEELNGYELFSYCLDHDSITFYLDGDSFGAKLVIAFCDSQEGNELRILIYFAEIVGQLRVNCIIKPFLEFLAEINRLLGCSALIA